eukprot:CAMPEP_0204572258 /NCGR_PEP_ID=MMETSP0661-20131031/39357_1 /ASSEMBLY_ACC=CAM_ASM_000606 /TAXON_ID=109239 /ORGANISM="Alexandrium margalefi, Strain AMGDE01CS-322" /LENGTH=479 /DNA_ID=CAMNT_0051580597 /DNA_START=82 /DNA_END=1517 /DNA_ORIENTATION=-
MKVRITSVRPSGVSLVLDVPSDTTILDLKRQLASHPHKLQITSETRVLAKLQKGMLIALEDSATARRALVLQGLGAEPQAGTSVHASAAPTGQQGKVLAPLLDTLEHELRALKSGTANGSAAAGADSALPRRTEWGDPLQRSFRVVVVRHGERADLVFGSGWIQQCFPRGGGEYVRCDLNMPRSLPSRPLEHWAVDPPITELGRWQARQIGEALADEPPIGAIYTSPALRCRQTAQEIQQWLPGLPRVGVEPGLFEMGSWGGPDFEAAFQPIDPTALTKMPAKDEGVEAWYQRSDGVLRRLMEHHARTKSGDLLLVAHALSHEVLTYGALSLLGPLPAAVRKVDSREAKIYVMKARGAGGTAPINTSCGVAALWYSSSKNSLSPLEHVSFSLTHHQNSAFAFHFSDPSGAEGSARGLRSAAPAAVATGAATWLVLPAEGAEGEAPVLSPSVSGASRDAPSTWQEKPSMSEGRASLPDSA